MGRWLKNGWRRTTNPMMFMQSAFSEAAGVPNTLRSNHACQILMPKKKKKKMHNMQKRTSRSSRPRSSTPCNLVNIQYYVAATLPGALSRPPIDPLLFRPHNFQQKKSWKKDRNFESKWQNFRRSNGYFIFQRIFFWMWCHGDGDGCDNFYSTQSTNNSSPLQILLSDFIWMIPLT